jgi:hypothetical protein
MWVLGPCTRVKDSEIIFGRAKFEKPNSVTNDSEGPSHGQSEIDDVNCKLEIPDNEWKIAVWKFSTSREGVCQEI